MSFRCRVACVRAHCVAPGRLAWRFGGGDVVLQHPHSSASATYTHSALSVEMTVTHQMIDHRHEQIKEQRSPALLHLHLHRATALEGAAAADDEREVMCAELAV